MRYNSDATLGGDMFAARPQSLTAVPITAVEGQIQPKIFETYTGSRARLIRSV